MNDFTTEKCGWDKTSGCTGAALWTELREMFDCPVCLRQYQDPRILPECGHQCCKTCLEEICNRQYNMIVCLTCGVGTWLELNTSIGDLPKPLVFNKLHTTLNRMNEAGLNTCGPCGAKDRPTPANMYCHQCKTKLCLGCATKHSNIEFFSAHQTSDISTITFCSNHDDESLPAEVFCFTCKTTICLRCALSDLSDHHGHTIDHLHKVAGHVRASLDDCRTRAATEILNLQGYKTKMEFMRSSWQTGLEHTKLLIQEVGCLIRVLELQVGHLANSATSRYDQNCQRLNDIQAGLTGESEKQKEILKMAANLSFATDVQQVATHPSLIESITWPQHPLFVEFQNILQRPEVQSIYNTMNHIRAKLCVTESDRLYYNLDSQSSIPEYFQAI